MLQTLKQCYDCERLWVVDVKLNAFELWYGYETAGPGSGIWWLEGEMPPPHEWHYLNPWSWLFSVLTPLLANTICAVVVMWAFGVLLLHWTFYKADQLIRIYFREIGMLQVQSQLVWGPTLVSLIVIFCPLLCELISLEILGIIWTLGLECFQSQATSC